MFDTGTLPDHPFTLADLADLGLTPRRLRQAVADGTVRRILHGVYAAGRLPDSLELRVLALQRVVAPGHVVRDRTAAWLHGVDVLLVREHEVLPAVETCALRGKQPTDRAGADGRTRDLAKVDIMTISGVRVTTPLRTALDLGCMLRRRDALAALDQFARVHAITREQLARGAVRYFRRRGVRQLRELIPLVDARAESPRESWMRLAIHDAGLPAPEPQVWIEIDGVPTYRLDLAYRRHRIAVEYDGYEHHERTDEQRVLDEERRAWLRDNGWTVIVVRRGDFTGEALDRWIGQLRWALRPTYTNIRF